MVLKTALTGLLTACALEFVPKVYVSGFEVLETAVKTVLNGCLNAKDLKPVCTLCHLPGAVTTGF